MNPPKRLNDIRTKVSNSSLAPQVVALKTKVVHYPSGEKQVAPKVIDVSFSRSKQGASGFVV